jgi:hypothetical protein
MISTGVFYGGREHEKSGIERLLRGVGSAVVAVRGDCDFESGRFPTVNVVFYVSGSLVQYDLSEIEVGRFSRKRKKVMIAVPVPQEVAETGGPLDFVIDALRKAVTMAAEVFARRKISDFDLTRAQAIVEQVKRTLEQTA